VVSNLIYSQNGWILQTVNSDLDINYLSYKDTNICQLASKNFVTTPPKVLVSTNGTNSWQTIELFSFGITHLQFLNSLTGYLLDYQTNEIKLRRTNNSGLSWSVVTTLYVGTGNYKKLYFINSNTGFIWDSYPPRKTTNGGVNWIDATFSPVTGYSEICFVNTDTGFINGTNASVNCIAKTTNIGINWNITEITSFCIKIRFADINTGYAMCNNSLLLKTTNCGANWNVIPILPPEILISISVVNQFVCYILTQSGKILKTTNGGTNFTIQTLPQSGVSFREVEFASVTSGVVLCSGGKIMKTTSGGEILGIQTVSNIIPKEFNVSQNYPNPFNPATQINFDVPERTYVDLVVYDQLGREVETLVNEQLSAGSYKYEWNAVDYPSGVYFYKLQAGDFAETKKMILIK